MEDENDYENSSDDSDGSENEWCEMHSVTLRQYREGHEDKAGRALELSYRNSSIFQV